MPVAGKVCEGDSGPRDQPKKMRVYECCFTPPRQACNSHANRSANAGAAQVDAGPKAHGRRHMLRIARRQKGKVADVYPPGLATAGLHTVWKDCELQGAIHRSHTTAHASEGAGTITWLGDTTAYSSSLGLV